MKRFFIGLLILGTIVAVVAAIMKRQSGEDVGWDEFTRDKLAEASDAMTKAAGAITDASSEATQAASDAGDGAADDITIVVEETERSTS